MVNPSEAVEILSCADSSKDSSMTSYDMRQVIEDEDDGCVIIYEPTVEVSDSVVEVIEIDDNQLQEKDDSLALNDIEAALQESSETISFPETDDI